jgi:TolA-binding protein
MVFCVNSWPSIRKSPKLEYLSESQHKHKPKPKQKQLTQLEPQLKSQQKPIGEFEFQQEQKYFTQQVKFKKQECQPKHKSESVHRSLANRRGIVPTPENQNSTRTTRQFSIQNPHPVIVRYDPSLLVASLLHEAGFTDCLLNYSNGHLNPPIRI